MERFFIDHGMIHDRVTGKHVTTDEDSVFCDGINACCALLNSLSSTDADQRRIDIPPAIAEQVLSMGKVEWGATAEHTHEGHLEHLGESLRLTREAFNYEDVPVAMHGLYLEGTDTVLCHTGTSPNSGANAQALAGAWNWLVDQCATLTKGKPNS